jgi:hypothetical protein
MDMELNHTQMNMVSLEQVKCYVFRICLFLAVLLKKYDDLFYSPQHHTLVKLLGAIWKWVGNLHHCSLNILHTGPITVE